jgi:hypothetical protein
MKRTEKKIENTTAVQRAASNPAEPKALEFARTTVSTAPRSRKGNCIEVVAKKTREQLCDELIGQAEKATGTQSLDVAIRIINQVGRALVCPAPPGDMTGRMIDSITTISELAPQNAAEAMLATQMIATHEAALAFLYRATLPNQLPDRIDPNVLRATRLMRLHLQQIEAMQKLKGKAGQQKVTVEHVHVHNGGQAIVGALSGGEGGQ